MDASATALLLDALHGAIQPSTGCTEPGAIALNAATARKHAAGTFQRMTLRLDEYLYKNAKCVGIPGTSGRGVALCATMGVCAGNADASLAVLQHTDPEDVREAERLVREGLVTVEVVGDCDELFVQTELWTDCDCVRVTTLERHDHIAEIAHAPFHAADRQPSYRHDAPILQFPLETLVDFVEHVPIEALQFLQDGIEMNLAIARAGGEMDLGRAMRSMIARGAMPDTPMTQAKLLTATATYARMSGISLPVMAATGSGNQGITITMTLEGYAQAAGIPTEAKLRALALAHLVNIYGKAHMGNLSALCSCGVSSGLGASVAIVYLLGGSVGQMLKAAQNMIGSICGMICDGAKEGCANKVELAAGLAVQSAYLAVEDVGIPCDNGIVTGEWKSLFENLGTLAKDGMRETNRVIVRLMQKQ